MSTGDSWSAILADAVHNPHVPGITPPMLLTVYFFFIFYMAFMGWVLVSIFVAIILEYFNDSNAEEGIQVKGPLRLELLAGLDEVRDGLEPLVERLAMFGVEVALDERLGPGLRLAGAREPKG